MKLLYLIAVALLLAACGIDDPPKPVIGNEPHCATPEDKERLARFIIDCALAANPLADEEGEDLVQQCESTGIRTVCPIHRHQSSFNGVRWVDEELPMVEVEKP